MTDRRASRRDVIRAGLRDAAPMLLGTVPFGLVAGATPVAGGLAVSHAMGLSVVVFAGASQIATADALIDGATVAVAVATAWAINLRLLLYSASLAPRLAHAPRRIRMVAAFFVIDQAYALADARWTGDDPPEDRVPYYLAMGALLGSTWLGATLVGALAGASMPDSVPLEFMVPLVFLVLLVPALASPAAIAAAIGGALGAVIAGETGAARLAVLIGGAVGIAVGTIVDTVRERRAVREQGAEGERRAVPEPGAEGGAP